MRPAWIQLNTHEFVATEPAMLSGSGSGSGDGYLSLIHI